MYTFKINEGCARTFELQLVKATMHDQLFNVKYGPS